MKQKKDRLISFIIILIGGLAIVPACTAVTGTSAQNEPAQVPILPTQTTTTPTPTTPGTPTATFAPAAETAVPTASSTGSAACLDAATFVADVTIPDGTTISPDTGFNKTWRLKNSGTCTWDHRYQLIHVGGPRLGATAANFALPATVAPGQTIDLSLSLIAPAEPATYQGDWKLQNPQGHPFGVGPNRNTPVWVNIVVAPPLPAHNGRISGFAWQDQNFDNQVEASEFLPAVSITLAAGANCGTALATTITDDDGRFQFTDLAAGEYCLIGTDGSLTVGQSGLVLAENQQLVDVNVTWPPVWPDPASVSGWVWHDACELSSEDGIPVIFGLCVDDGNGGYVADGMIQPDETTIAGVTVKLISGSCVGDDLPAQRTAVTNDDGRYHFDHLQPGVYCVFIDATEGNNAAILGNGQWTFPGHNIGYHELSVQAGDEVTPVNFGWDVFEADN